MRVFQKLGNSQFLVDNNLKSNKLGRKLRKIGFFSNHCRIHWNFLKLGILHNRYHSFKNCEKFSPIVNQNRHFLKCHGYCYTNSVNCSYPKASKAAINCSYIYCEEGHDKVLQTHTFLSNTHTYAHWCYNHNWEHLQNKNQINYLHNYNKYTA